MPELPKGYISKNPTKLILDDCLDAMREMGNGCVDAIVTDPPYGLEFMGKGWDHGVPGVPYWNKCFWVLKQGGCLLAFGGTRTWHRLACNIEDAGFELCDTLMWLHGQGFPKSEACLKPAWEPIILACKPSKHVLPLGIDECRVGLRDVKNLRRGATTGNGMGYHGSGPQEVIDGGEGRWPANLVLSHHDDCRDECHPDCSVRLLDEQTGNKGGGFGSENRGESKGRYGNFSGSTKGKLVGFGDKGGASRFFYCSKARRRERELGCEHLPKGQRDHTRNADQPSMQGGGGNPHNRGAVQTSNHHPTIKPLRLMEWLVKLCCPRGAVVLDPFMGSGTTGVACVKAGRRFIGIEKEAEYMEIAKARINHALSLRHKQV